MKESEAWLILAEEHDANRTQSEFLCVNLDHAEGAYPNDAIARIPEVVRRALVRRIHDAVGDSGAAYSFGDFGYPNFKSYLTQAHKARVLACLMFGQQARDEERPR